MKPFRVYIVAVSVTAILVIESACSRNTSRRERIAAENKFKQIQSIIKMDVLLNIMLLLRECDRKQTVEEDIFFSILSKINYLVST